MDNKTLESIGSDLNDLRANKIIGTIGKAVLNKVIPYDLGGFLGSLVFPDPEQPDRFKPIQDQLNVMSAKIDALSNQVESVRAEIKWSTLVLEAQPAATRISNDFKTIKKFRPNDQESIRHFVDEVLDTNNGVAYSLTSIHQVIMGPTTIDPSQQSIVKSWGQQVVEKCHDPVLVSERINNYYTALVQIQLQGLLLLCNAYKARKEDNLANDAVSDMAENLAAQVNCLRNMNLCFSTLITPFTSTKFYNFPNLSSCGTFTADRRLVVVGSTGVGSFMGVTDIKSASTHPIYNNKPVFDPGGEMCLPGVAALGSRVYTAAGSGSLVIRRFDEASARWVDAYCQKTEGMIGGGNIDTQVPMAAVGQRIVLAWLELTSAYMLHFLTSKDGSNWVHTVMTWGKEVPDYLFVDRAGKPRLITFDNRSYKMRVIEIHDSGSVTVDSSAPVEVLPSGEGMVANDLSFGYMYGRLIGLNNRLSESGQTYAGSDDAPFALQSTGSISPGFWHYGITIVDPDEVVSVAVYHGLHFSDGSGLQLTCWTSIP